MENKFIPKFKIALLLPCLIFLFFPLLVSAQVPVKDKLKIGEEQASAPAKEPDLNIIKSRRVEYSASNFRDPFFPSVSLDKQEEPKLIKRKDSFIQRRPSEIFTFSIQGILWNPDNPMAIINNQLLKKGESIVVKRRKGDAEKIEIMDIDKDGVTVVYRGSVEKLPAPASLELKKYKEERNE